ncbi:hypothetical protein KAM338_18620 [Aeromonas caviae]|uniref:ATLF-like domain-containing protein n=2 Tax=Aeromonas TaxID=642 RepID=A0A6S5BZ87_AERVE|nr:MULTISPECIES: peptidase [Aeromonas]QXW29296.1 hypothetical protein KXJ75_22465 [Aeromonas sanarellii]GKQ61685.1 hypothetical protein KAM338_18620 [Aeromonas caviae]MBC8673252.1 peptidase [Aeromonas hydrophila]MBC8689104.1 peptidase [Aeromonas hydrophila]RCF44424.1 peptidase [Aeromonas hydrophila]
MKKSLILSKIFILLLLGVASYVRGCDIYALLEEMEFPDDIDTIFELKIEMARQSGGTYYRDDFIRYLEDLNPAFKVDAELTLEQLQWAKAVMDAGTLKRLSSGMGMVDVNTKSTVPISEAKYLVGKELAKLDPIILSTNWNLNSVGRVIVTNDNVTTYWTHLKGVPVRGHPDGVTWDSIPGAGSPDGENELVIALTKNNKGEWTIPKGNHGSSNLVIHEFAHTLDKLVGQRLDGRKLSKDPEFYRNWYNDYQSGKITEQYYLQPENNYENALEESFAEGFAKYFENNGRVTSYDWPYISSYIGNYLMKKLKDK